MPTRLLFQRMGILVFALNLCATAWNQEFTDIDHQAHRPFDDPNTKAVVMFFVLPDCPISNQYQPLIKRLAETYQPKGIEFYLVHADPTVDRAAALKHRKDFQINIPVLLDPGHQWVKQTGATVSPEAAVLDSENKLLYRGRIDDRYPKPGVKRFRPTSNDLEDSLKAVLAGKEIEHPRTKAVGCYIPPLEE